MNLREALDTFGFSKLQITTENVNKSCVTISTSHITPIELLCCIANCEPAIDEIFALGAVITSTCYIRCYYEYLPWFLELVDRKETSVFMSNWCKAFYFHLEPATIFIDYGAKPPIEWDTLSVTSPGGYYKLVLYHTQVCQRVVRCRRTLVALVAYCRKSAYTGLRPVYAELAKWMWRMRGGGERCGPRGEKWK